MNLPKTLRVSPFQSQQTSWPQQGRHIMAQFDHDSICVYQAYQPLIADYASKHQRFGAGFSFARMSWIKPNFLWMMYRSGWASKPGQEKVLAIKIRRKFFEEILTEAVPSSFDTDHFATREEWQKAVEKSSVRLQWDPDHCPNGRPLGRRAVQLGLRGDILSRFGTEEIISIEDITPFVLAQSIHRTGSLSDLLTPTEEIFIPDSEAAIVAAGIDSQPCV